MIDNNIILKNPVIRPGYYYAKIKDIDTEASSMTAIEQASVA